MAYRYEKNQTFDWFHGKLNRKMHIFFSTLKQSTLGDEKHNKNKNCN